MFRGVLVRVLFAQGLRGFLQTSRKSNIVPQASIQILREETTRGIGAVHHLHNVSRYEHLLLLGEPDISFLVGSYQLSEVHVS